MSDHKEEKIFFHIEIKNSGPSKKSSTQKKNTEKQKPEKKKKLNLQRVVDLFAEFKEL